MSAEQIGPAIFNVDELDSIPSSLVEGVFASALVEIKNALDDIYEALGADSVTECVAANYAIIVGEVRQANGLLAGYDDSALRPKHRASRALFSAFESRLLRNTLSPDSSDAALSRFAADIVTFLKCAHMCLHEFTDRKKRYYYKRKFLDG